MVVLDKKKEDPKVITIHAEALCLALYFSL